MSVYIVYPDRRFVPDAVIQSWFADAVADGIIPADQADAVSVDSMADALADVGLITRGLPPHN